MRFLSTRTHGVLDYVMVLLLLASPWLFGFAGGGAATWTPVAVGAALLAWSFATDYEPGFATWLGMPGHLWLDALAGLFLALSPWALGFADRVVMPHVVLGGVVLGLSAVTSKAAWAPDAGSA